MKNAKKILYKTLYYIYSYNNNGRDGGGGRDGSGSGGGRDGGSSGSGGSGRQAANGEAASPALVAQALSAMSLKDPNCSVLPAVVNG